MSTRKLHNILVTGGCGFIGSNFIRYLFGLSDHQVFQNVDFTGTVINVDCLTYAGNASNLKEVESQFGKSSMNQRYFFENVDICNTDEIMRLFKKYDIDTVVHFAAESHVDRSISGPAAFIQANINGTFNMLECARLYWTNNDGTLRDDVLFHHISTDEVYGSLGPTGQFTETTPYDPRSPYSASKASSDHIVMAYSHTYGLPITLSNCTNNYGPYQFPEKLIPLMVLNIKNGKDLPVYGTGENIRDWIYVEDHNAAVWLILNKGRCGEKYNIGGENEWTNINLLKKLITYTAARIGKPESEVLNTIKYIKDRPGHDMRYAIDCTKIKTELGWKRQMTFEQGLAHTVDWYLSHPEWTERILNGEYRNWIKSNYEERR